MSLIPAKLADFKAEKWTRSVNDTRTSWRHSWPQSWKSHHVWSALWKEAINTDVTKVVLLTTVMSSIVMTKSTSAASRGRASPATSPRPDYAPALAASCRHNRNWRQSKDDTRLCTETSGLRRVVCDLLAVFWMTSRLTVPAPSVVVCMIVRYNLQRKNVGRDHQPGVHNSELIEWAVSPVDIRSRPDGCQTWADGQRCLAS